jgi:hypothetical protein
VQKETNKIKNSHYFNKNLISFKEISFFRYKNRKSLYIVIT